MSSTPSPLSFAMPQGESIPLELRPRLESWDAHDHPSQVGLREWVAHVTDRAQAGLKAIDGAASVRIDIGLPDEVDPLWQRDLDNYLFPIARALPNRVVSFWATKRRAPLSELRVQPAHVAAAPEWPRLDIAATPAGEDNLKQVVRAAAAEHSELPEGPVAVEACFACGPGRDWRKLWKPTIDALDPILGRTYDDRDWDPQDGRIVRLGLHRQIQQDLDHACRATIWAAAADPAWPELDWLRSMTAAEQAKYLKEHRSRRLTRRPRARVRGQAMTARGGPQVTDSATGVALFRNDEAGYLAWIASHQSGWVVNTDRTPKATYLQLHKASCPTISEERTAGAYTERGYVKFCATRRGDLNRFFESKLAATPRWNCTQCG